MDTPMYTRMKWSLWLKTLWWGILVICFGILLLSRLEMILTGEAKTVDIVLLLVWFGLVIAPLFSKVQLWGFGFKQELETFKNDLRHDLNVLRTDIRMGIHQQIVLNTGLGYSQ